MRGFVDTGEPVIHEAGCVCELPGYSTVSF